MGYSLIKCFLLAFGMIILPVCMLFSSVDIQYIEGWKNLLHFSNNRSTVISDNFFLHEKGAEDPVLELETMVDLLNSKDGEIVASNYPARYLWLYEHGYAVPAFDLKNFKELEDYVKSFHKDSLYLVFASEHINSPSSSFGHVLLVFSSESSSILLADTIHFAAETCMDEDGFFKYAFKGVTGRYDGYFFRSPLFILKNKYNLEEQRDLYFHKLNLNSKQILFMVYHLYELRKAKYKYYFLNKNCAYQIDALLKVVYGIENRYHFPVIPVDILNSYKDNISEQFILPATSKRAQNLFKNMSRQSKIEYKEVHNKGVQQNENLDEKVREVLNIEAEYSFRCLGEIPKDYYDILALKFPHTFYSNIPLNVSMKNNKNLISIGLYKDKLHEGLAFGYRLIGRDLYDIQNYKMQESDISFIDLELRIRDYDSLYLQQFDILRLKSLFNRGILSSDTVWAFDLGIDRKNFSNKAFGNLELSLGLGKGSNRIGLCCLLGMGFQSSLQECDVYIKPSIDFLFYPNDKIKIGLSCFEKYCRYGNYSEVRVFTLQSFDDFSIVLEYLRSNSNTIEDSLTFSIRF